MKVFGFFAHILTKSIYFSYEVLLTLDKKKHNFDGPIYYYVFNSLLFSLLVLHIYWWVLIYRMLVRQIKTRNVGDDVRSGKHCPYATYANQFSLLTGRSSTYN